MHIHFQNLCAAHRMYRTILITAEEALRRELEIGATFDKYICRTQPVEERVSEYVRKTRLKEARELMDELQKQPIFGRKNHIDLKTKELTEFEKKLVKEEKGLMQDYKKYRNIKQLDDRVNLNLEKKVENEFQSFFQLDEQKMSRQEKVKALIEQQRQRKIKKLRHHALTHFSDEHKHSEIIIQDKFTAICDQKYANFKFCTIKTGFKRQNRAFAFKLLEGDFNWICLGVAKLQKIHELQYTLREGQFSKIFRQIGHEMYFINNIGYSFHSKSKSQNCAQNVPFFLKPKDILSIAYNHKKEELIFQKEGGVDNNYTPFTLKNVPSDQTLHPFILFNNSQNSVYYIDDIEYIPYFAEKTEVQKERENTNVEKVVIHKEVDDLLQENAQVIIEAQEKKKTLFDSSSDEEDEEENSQNNKNKEKKVILSKFDKPKYRKKIQRIFELLLQECYKLMDLRLDFKTVYREKLFTGKPYQRNNSKDYFQAIKDGNLYLVEKFITNDRYIVYDINLQKETGLHVAVKREKYDIVKLLIEYHVCIDQRDQNAKSALYYSVRNCNSQIMRLLLKSKAAPWAGGPRGDFKKYLMDRLLREDKDKDILVDMQFLRAAYLTHTHMMMHPYKLKNTIWQDRYFHFDSISQESIQQQLMQQTEQKSK